MNTILDNLYNLDILQKINLDILEENKDTNGKQPNKIQTKKQQDNSLAYTKHKYNKTAPNPSLSQGLKFKTYQEQILNSGMDKINSIELNEDNGNNKKNKKNKNNNKKENFTGSNQKVDPDLSEQSNSLLKTIQKKFSSSDSKNLASIKEEYYKTLVEYNKLLSEINNSYTNYTNRISDKNPYLNKYILFTTGEMCYVTSKGIAKHIPSMDILNSISGKNGCPNYSQGIAVNINIPWIPSYNIEGTQLPTNPPLIMGKNMKSKESCGYEGTNVFVNKMLSEPKSSFIGCYQDNSKNPTMTFIGDAPLPSNSSDTSDGNQNGKYNFNQCQDAAVLGGYSYFALQNVNTSSGLGYCAVSNDLANSTQYGRAFVPVQLWSSNTSGTSASFAVLTNKGSLNVQDDSGKIYFTTPNDNANCSQIYSVTPNVDAPGNDISYLTNQNIDSCKTSADNIPSSSGFIFNTSDNNSCWIKSGEMSNQVNNNARTIYKKTIDTSKCNFYLAMLEDGNMCIYKDLGEGKSSFVWGTMTNGKQQEKNANYIASKNKFGLSYMINNQVLNKGEFISSQDGSLLLKMENDGNLVLYTFKTNCNNITNANNANNANIANTTNNNYYGGGNMANALYNIDSVGIAQNMGQVAYINSDSQLYPYPSSNISYANTYSIIKPNTNILGSDLHGASFSNCNSIQDCMNACNSNEKCNSFVYDTSGPSALCIPKNVSNVNSPNTFTPSNYGVTSFIRDKKPAKLPMGVDLAVNNMDSLQYENYPKGTGAMENNIFGFNNVISSVQKQQLSQLQDKLKQLSSVISDTSSNYSEFNNKVNEQMKKDLQGFNEYLEETNIIEQKISGFNNHNNLDNIVKDTNIQILQQNYSYMGWSILAALVIIVALNVSK